MPAAGLPEAGLHHPAPIARFGGEGNPIAQHVCKTARNVSGLLYMHPSIDPMDTNAYGLYTCDSGNRRDGMGTSTVGTAVVSGLRNALLTGEIGAGVRLSYSKLADRFGVSRIPVREAMQTLVAEGLVVMVDGVPYSRRLSILELQELFEMRMAVEPYLTQIAVPQVGRAEIIKMTGFFEVMSETTDVVEWLEANANFHATMYHRANRPMTIEHIDNLRKLADRYLFLHLAVIGNVEHLQVEHAAILEAAKAADGARINELTRTHLETSHEFIVRYLLANDDEDHA